MANENLTQSRGLAKLRQAKEVWHLTDDGDTYATKYSLLQPVIYQGKTAMLKVPLTSEEHRGFQLLACWNGEGAAKVYKYDTNALLMERATGERSLRQMVTTGKEDEANTIICGLVEKLHSLPCRRVADLIPLPEWFRSLGEIADHYGGFFRVCHNITIELFRNPLAPVALHGDIHYDNILDSGSRGWIAIDPKGLVGERGFDLANIFCNPDITIAGSPERLSKQSMLVASAANLEQQRLLRWIIAWSGLSASWAVEDGEDAQLPILVGELAIKELTSLDHGH